MNTFLIIILTLAADALLLYIIRLKKQKRLSEEKRNFEHQLNHIMNSKMPVSKKISEAKDLCRKTVGDMSFGVYIVLDHIEKEKTT